MLRFFLILQETGNGHGVDQGGAGERAEDPNAADAGHQDSVEESVDDTAGRQRGLRIQYAQHAEHRTAK